MWEAVFRERLSAASDGSVGLGVSPLGTRLDTCKKETGHVQTDHLGASRLRALDI